MTGRRRRGELPARGEPASKRRKTGSLPEGSQPIASNERQANTQPSDDANPQPSETQGPQSARSRPRYEILEPTRVTAKGKRKYKKTELGKIFGAAVNAGTGESGWTPIDQEQRQTWLGFRREDEKKEFQQEQLDGFDSNQLRAMDVVPVFNKEVKDIAGLDNPLHPIFDRRHWRTRETTPANRAHFKIGMGKRGYWEAQNPIVWKILEPILQLASQFIMNSQISHFWDSLIRGERKALDPPAPPEFGTLRSFHRRPAAECYSRRALVQSLVNKAAGRIRFGIENGYTIANTGLCHPPDDSGEEVGNFLAFCFRYDSNGTGPMDLNVSFHMLTPFFRKDLTQAEGFALKCYAAQTFVHELGHALGDMVRRDNKASEAEFSRRELFFEDEALAEYGYSVTMANMGLIIDATPSHPTPFVYFAHAWPRRDGDDIRRTTLKYARPLHNYEIPKIYYPIPCKFFEDLCQKDFWDGFVSVYMDTGQALHIGKFSAGGQQRNMVYVPGMPIWNARPPPPNDPPVVIMPATRDSVVADSIHRSRLQDQSRARAALLTARTSLTNWRVRFNRKKNKHDWHDAERERIRQNVQEEVDLPGSPFSDLTTSEPDEPDPNLQEGNESDFDYEEILPFQAPTRYTYIHRSMCQFRFVIGLETMTKKIPMNLLLEYLNREISKLKKRTVGPEEFYQYIKFLATEWDVCFDLFEGEYGAADVSYRELGWPSVEEFLPQPKPPLPDLDRSAEQFEKDLKLFRTLCLEDDDIWFKFETSATSRRAPNIDIDMDDIRQLHNQHCDVEDEVDADIFIHMVSRCPDLWDLGPPGIMRYVGIDPWTGAKAGIRLSQARKDDEMTDPDEEVGMGGDTTEEDVAMGGDTTEEE